MGPGDRFQIRLMQGIGFGVQYCNWPYTYNFSIQLLCFNIEIGLGLPYTDPDYEIR